MPASHQHNVLVTGVSSGIGLGLASHYLDIGHRVYGTSRRTPESLLHHSSFRFVTTDFRDERAIVATMKQFLAEVKHFDLVILNAGVLGCFGDLADAELADVKNTMQVNVWANKVVLDTLFGGGLTIKQVVTISSGAAVNGNRGWSGYSISKAALNMLTALYARERANTHFCALAPGLVDTAIQDELCALDLDPRFPALEVMRSKRKTIDMPTPLKLAPRLAEAIRRLPQLVDSGDYADIRTLPGVE